MTTALVTGATGFIGRYLVSDLLSKGWTCRLLVRPTSDVSGLPQAGVEIAQGDITLPASLEGVADGVDVVFHLAGAGHVAAISKDAYTQFRAANVTGVANVVEACRGRPLRKFVHVSSTAAMGLIRAPKIDEDSPPQPRTPYQLSKREGEQVVLDAWKNDSLPAVIVRPCMVYGPGGFGEFARMCRWMARGIFPRVGRGPSLTPMIHVRDVARGAALAAERGQLGQAYLLVGESLPIAEMRQVVLSTLNLDRPYPYVPLGVALAGAAVLEVVSRISGKPMPVSRHNIQSVTTGREFDIRKARNELGFEPALKLSESAAEVLGWLREQGAV